MIVMEPLDEAPVEVLHKAVRFRQIDGLAVQISQLERMRQGRTREFLIETAGKHQIAA